MNARGLTALRDGSKGILRGLVVVCWGAIVLSFIGISAVVAQSNGHKTPCGVAQGEAPYPGTKGLWLVDGGAPLYDQIVYDSNLGVCWLADANLAEELSQGNLPVREKVMAYLSMKNEDGSTPVINPDGTMDYETALNWVQALNLYNGGKGWLNHNHWQLPATPQTDSTCSSQNGEIYFGVQCTNSALGSLYNVGLALDYPHSVASFLSSVTPLVFPFFGLQPGLYWTSDPPNVGGRVTFSFNNDQNGANTTKYNLFHVLPMTSDKLGPLPSGTGVLPYGSGLAVYDTKTKISWPSYANLAAMTNFGVKEKTIVHSDVNGNNVTVPFVDSEGGVYFTGIDPWIAAMNSHNYAGSKNWTLPSLADLQQLHDDMGLTPGQASFEDPTFAGPIILLQPGFYWACVRDPETSKNAPCDPALGGGTSPGPSQTPMEYSFNFDDGFQGTDQNTKQFYVMVYYPAP